MRVAIIHYWLTGMRGGEKVLEALCELYPQADIFTHVLDSNNISPLLNSHNIRTTFINRLPAATKLYQKYLPLMPLALRLLDLSDYDLVISSESGPAKGVRTKAPHICYCHTPMRYLWDFYHEYLESSGFVTRQFFRLLAPWLRRWDLKTSKGVDYFVANSYNVAERIKRIYGREAEVIYPPVDIAGFMPHGIDNNASGTVQDNPAHMPYLMLGQLVGYKRADLAVKAFNQSGRNLVIAGTGPEEAALKALAGPNIIFAGRLDDSEILGAYRNCRALIFPGEEDFGIVPVEAQACGRPVIAFGRGGALETVKDGVTGLFFKEQTPEALNSVLDEFEAGSARFNPAEIRAHAETFAYDAFIKKMHLAVEKLLSQHTKVS